MEKITRFGPAGNSQSFIADGFKSSVDAPRWIYEKGLNAYEYQCGRGVLVGEETAGKIGLEAKKYGIALSIHAPYFMNLANPEAERTRKTIDYVIQSAQAARAMGADRIVVHAGSLLKRTRKEALSIACDTLKKVMSALDEGSFGDIAICPELMGCKNQLGNLDEIIALCKVDERLIPCIDFGHYNAREGGILKDKSDFEFIFDRLENELGVSRISSFHAHFSKIEYSLKSGEVRHLTFEDKTYGPEFLPLAEIIAERGYTPRIICESAGTQAEDALFMKNTLLEVQNK